MNLLEMNSMLSTLLADSSTNFYTDVERKVALNNACKYLNSEIQICKNTAVLSVATGDGSVQLPTDYVAPMYGGDWLASNGTTIQQLDVRSIRELRNRVSTWETETGIPASMVFEGARMYLYPWPNTPGTVDFSYLCLPNLLAADTDVPFYGDSRCISYHDCIVFYAAWQLVLKDRDFEAAQMFMQYFQSRKVDFIENLRRTGSFLTQPVWQDVYAEG